MTQVSAFDMDDVASRAWFRAHPLVFVLRRLLDRLQAGRLSVRLPSGARIDAAGAAPGPEAALHIQDWRAFRRLLLRGDIGFAEGYVAGDWTSPDLVALIRLAAANSPAMGHVAAGASLHRLSNFFLHRARKNSRRGSRRNIMSHYDLGNDFFRLWLDETMLYSSGLWDEATVSLEQAQGKKLARIGRWLDLEGGENILEIGCGWGALAAHLAQAGAGHILGLTLSPAQLSFARERLARERLDSAVELRLQDYRDVSGAFDRVVSIEMIEAVGEAYWPRYFKKIAEALKPGGKALIQAITIDEARFEDYRARPDFIQRHIFPGGFLPTRSVIAEQAARAGLRLAGAESFGLSYARTLAEWRHRFEKRWADIEALGFDAKFRRLWTYYLCYCEAGFLEQATDVGFFLLEKSGDPS
ncbi:cyclopropane-fatty-acyl-phospholipid synthase family protein [Rhodoblastus acidophilus]|uniref:Cyclopropane-fatty-acyl-phospholipid synthase family protein n=1 Tax=Candidatus Rhodoblastus alkanivorans TaxID=2954117 RepID=A0ABS9Z8T8_9HYPH|nr:cyclopropane-fatty-acyl-phospholipid synthase family protein [Candidatus Rhodoblastus alkanivorans]MCI4678354.1 cyclopropane-fatty-acyl-phospholipid synthase family protein [Candidatus Rhodoblastus alkanivorans]MCI4683612.1 cyclopropane-fatty-acyl-phospholipid synthase family protein [Candidatus Rhodoblastus alkanivorans]MDI4640928.1 cyclopropane-fatty-acyl-phospholipid synthase family protein [Rhodoblastus acidophilus]